MKYIVKSLIALATMMIIGTASAEMSTSDFEPFVGIDYQQTWMKTKDSSSQKFSPKSFPGANIYVGTKFMKNFGAELGVDQSFSKKKNWTTGNGRASGNTKLRRTGIHLDLLGYLPVNECFDVFASVGLGFTNIKSKINNSTANITQDVKTKNQAVLRLGVGAAYMITDSIGVRAKLGWENTGRLKQKDKIAATQSKDKLYKNSGMLLLGAFVKF